MFGDLDDSEQRLKKSVELMSSNELIEYCQLEFRRVFHEALPLERQKDKGIVNRFLKKYPEGGKIVKWIFYKHRGMGPGNEPFRMSLLASGLAWYHEDVLKQIEEDRLKEKDFVLKTSKGSKWTGFGALKGTAS